ncbi:MAG: quinolinate synthase NadA [Clostridia bacterium]|nr:quinolinate synthase NadA [Clostridia bacterium]
MENIDILKEKIIKLKNEKQAVIVAHTYQPREVQEIADLVGDSFQLSKFCATDSRKLIVFCGVHFMAESAKILSPEKKVLLPEISAGCPMADMANGKDLIAMKEKYPEAKVVCYINSTAEVKAVSDICCTSSNAVAIVKSLKAKQVIFVPDQNLGAYVSKFVPETEFILWNGYCRVHHQLDSQDVFNRKQEHPEAVVVMHPECRAETLEFADFVGSTKAIIDYVLNSDEEEFIIATETGVIDRINMLDPSKKLYLANERLLCRNMKKTNLEKVLLSLEKEQYEIDLDTEIMDKARGCLERMLEAVK